MFSAQLQALQRGSDAVAVALAGSYTAVFGSSQLLVAVPDCEITPVSLLAAETVRGKYRPALPLLPNRFIQAWQAVWSTCPLIAALRALIWAWFSPRPVHAASIAGFW